MKKAIAILLAAALTLSLAACGGGNGNTPSGTSDTPTTTQGTTPTTTTSENTTTSTTPEETETTQTTTETQVKTLAIGETAANDVMEFTLTRIEFAERLSPADYPLKSFNSNGKEFDVSVSADEGNILLAFYYTIKLVGRQSVTFDETGRAVYRFRNDGLYYDDSSHIYIDYDTGFNYYDFNIYSDINSNNQWYKIALDERDYPQLLGSAVEYRGYIEVPKAVMENTDKPLMFGVYIPSDNESTGVDSIIDNIDNFTPVNFVYDIRADVDLSSSRAIEIDRELQGTWISQDRVTTFVFDNGKVTMDGGNGIGTVFYYIMENTIMMTNPTAAGGLATLLGYGDDIEISFEYENGLLELSLDGELEKQ